MSQATSNRDNFEAWFGLHLANLIEDESAGFVLTMIAFPILERYLLAHSNNEPNTRPFNQSLLTVIPELQTEQNANLFWSIYRHGILHNVALSRETHGLSWLKPIVEVWPNGKVWMNPRLFATRVLETIRNNFGTFERGNYPLSQSQVVIEGTPGTPSYTTYLSTGMPPRA